MVAPSGDSGAYRAAAAVGAEWICVGPWAVPADFRHARHSVLRRFAGARREASRWVHEVARRCGGCRISREDATTPPSVKGDWFSFRHEFWFRRTPKCGQMSVSQLLQRCEKQLDLHPNTVLATSRGGDGIDEILAAAPRFTYVALARDPIDRFVSGYHELWARMAALSISRAVLRGCLGLGAERLRRRRRGSSMRRSYRRNVSVVEAYTTAPRSTVSRAGRAREQNDSACHKVDPGDPGFLSLANSEFF